MTTPALPEGSLQTRNCVRCLKRPARHWTGHVTIGERMITSGWCADCCAKLERYEFVGWDGHYRDEMGVEPSTIPGASSPTEGQDG